VSRVIAIHQGQAGPPTRNDRFVPVLDLIQRHGLLDRFLLTPPCRDRDDAENVRRSIYTSARYYCSCGVKFCTRKYDNLTGCPDGGQRLSVRADVVKNQAGKYCVQLRVYDKREAMRAVVDKYGPDPSKWPYQSKARKLKLNGNV
jgi:hypothetical protein